MRLFRSRPRPEPERLPLVLPALEGTDWPATSAHPSFEASTYHEMAVRRAYEPAAHARADRLLDEALPLLRTGASAEDEPYLRKVFLTAARVGVGLGLVEREATRSAPDELDAGIAGALGAARRGLPSMQPEWTRMAAWFLLAGHYLGRQEPDHVEQAAAQLIAALGPTR